MNKIRVSILVLALLAFSNATLARSGLCEDLVYGIGALVYFYAYPNASYEEAFCEGSKPSYYGSTLYYFTVLGTGMNGGPLWTEVIVEVSSDLELLDLRFGNHNSFFWPPGTSSAVFGFILEEIAEAINESDW